ncbi:hypothetical protein BPO_1317 [Bergeyella porcorum]|uniref:Uncharacterized protein n=1 Tax=Bergeyella porcorum TaxID=1735111 RepID=A0AAU0EZV1_9FLAO
MKFTPLWDQTERENLRFPSVIAGKEDYEVTEGEILFEGEDIAEDAPEERAHKGIFLSFQYPVEIPGVSNTNFIKRQLTKRVKPTV